MAKAEFYGASGTRYIFDIYPLGTQFYDVGGVYILTREFVNQQREIRYQPLYIGQTKSFLERLTTSHEKWNCAVQHRLNSICACVDTNRFSRLISESDLLKNYNTPCNDIRMNKSTTMQYLNRQDIYTLINAGYRAYRQGNYRDAIVYYNVVICLNPQNPITYRLRADAKIKIGQYQEAIYDCNTAIQLDPVNPAYLTRGFAYYFSYQNEAAIADFTAAIRLNHNPAYAYKFRADVKRDLHLYYDAWSDYQQALKHAQHNGYDLLIAQILPAMRSMYSNPPRLM